MNATLGTWLILFGLLAIAGQVIVSIVTALKAKSAETAAESDSLSTAGFGDMIAEVLKGVITTIPLGALGFLLVLTGLIVGGWLDIGELFPAPAETP